MPSSKSYKLVFYSPREETQNVLEQIFSRFPQVAGVIGEYDQCAYVTKGTGQFRSRNGKKEFVKEDRVEVQVGKDAHVVKEIVELIKSVHPYGDLAYNVYKLEQSM